MAIILDSYLSLWEQQSSYNPNMPVRGLMYFGKLYDKYIETNELNIYGTKLIKIPTPRYIVFYNGNKNTEAITELKLSDAFINPDKTNKFEWTAIMYNLNKGKNDDLLRRCKPLADYMTLINYIREFQIDYELSVAVDKAIDCCIEENILRDFLRSHRAEVRDMCITEYNEKVFVNGIRAEGLAAIVRSLKKFYKDFASLYAAIKENEEYADITEEEVKKYY